MQVTVTVNVPQERYERVRGLRMYAQAGKVTRHKVVTALPATQEIPVIAAPVNREDAERAFLATCEAAVAKLQREQTITVIRDDPLIALRPFPSQPARKPSVDIDATTRKELEDYHLIVSSNAIGERSFRRKELQNIAAFNKKNGATMQRDPESEDESDGKIAGYTLVADAVRCLIDALATDYEAFLDAVPAQVERLESAVSNASDTYNVMRDGIISEGAKEIARRWMGEE
jgi:hypothetical protein